MLEQLTKALERAVDEDFQLVHEARKGQQVMLRQVLDVDKSMLILGAPKLPESVKKEVLNGLAILAQETASHMEVPLFSLALSHYLIVEPKQHA